MIGKWLAEARLSSDATSRLSAWSWSAGTEMGDEVKVCRGLGDSGLSSAAATISGVCSVIKCGAGRKDRRCPGGL